MAGYSCEGRMDALCLSTVHKIARSPDGIISMFTVYSYVEQLPGDRIPHWTDAGCPSGLLSTSVRTLIPPHCRSISRAFQVIFIFGRLVPAYGMLRLRLVHGESWCWILFLSLPPSAESPLLYSLLHSGHIANLSDS